jgi:predicted Zn-dependent protease
MDERCLMHFSGGVEDVDRIPLTLCRYCSLYLKEATGRQVGMTVSSKAGGKE